MSSKSNTSIIQNPSASYETPLSQKQYVKDLRAKYANNKILENPFKNYAKTTSKKNKYISKMVNKFLSKNALTGKNIQEIKKNKEPEEQECYNDENKLLDKANLQESIEIKNHFFIKDNNKSISPKNSINNEINSKEKVNASFLNKNLDKDSISYTYTNSDNVKIKSSQNSNVNNLNQNEKSDNLKEVFPINSKHKDKENFEEEIININNENKLIFENNKASNKVEDEEDISFEKMASNYLKKNRITMEQDDDFKTCFQKLSDRIILNQGIIISYGEKSLSKIEKGFTKMTKTLSDVIKEGFSSLNKNN